MLNNKYQRAAKTFPRGTKSPQEQPKTPSRRPKSPPRPSQEGPRAPKSGPRPPQDGPKTAQDPSRSPLKTVLEPSWDHQTTRSKSRSIFVKRPPHFGSILEPKTAPKSTPNRSQNESKIKTKHASLFYPSWSRLIPVLRRSYARFGA